MSPTATLDRHPGIMHCDLAAFEASADGHKYCLVAAVTIEVDNVSKLLPFFVPTPKKDAVCATAALKEALTMCENRNLHQNYGFQDCSHPGRWRW